MPFITLSQQLVATYVMVYICACVYSQGLIQNFGLGGKELCLNYAGYADLTNKFTKRCIELQQLANFGGVCSENSINFSSEGDRFGGGGEHFRLGGEIPGFHDLCINL